MADELTQALTALAERGTPRGASIVLDDARRDAAGEASAGWMTWRRGLAVAVGAAAAVALLVAIPLLLLGTLESDEASPTITEPPVVTTVVPETPTTVAVVPLPGSEASGAVDDVRDVAVAADGTLWAATRGGVARWDPATGEVVAFSEEHGLPSTDVSFVASAPDGTIWVAGYEWMARWDGSWTVFTPDDVPELGNSDLGDVSVAPDGTVWVTIGLSGLLRFDGVVWTTAFAPPAGTASPWTGSLAVAQDGTVWATQNAGGVVVAYDGDWRQYTGADGLPGRAFTVAVAPDGAVWVGGDGLYGDPNGDVPASGIARYDGTKWTAFTTADGLLSNDADIAIGSDGTVWAVHSEIQPKGISRFDGARWTTYPDLGGRGWGAAVAPDGTLWMPSRQGLIGFDGTDTTHLAVGAASAASGRLPAVTLTPTPDENPVRVSTAIGDLEFTPLQMPVGHRFSQVAATPHGIVAIDSFTTLRWSTDGEIWEGSHVSVDPWRVTVAGNDVIVHGRSGAVRFIWKDDGWAEHSRLDIDGLVEQIVFGPDGAVAADGTRVRYSSDGVHFVEAERGPSQDLLPPTADLSTGLEGDLAGGCAFGPGSWSPDAGLGPVLIVNGGFVVITPAHPADWNAHPICTPLLWFSTDGDAWELVSEESPFGVGASIHDVAQHNGRFVAIGSVGFSEGAVWGSDDGLNWERMDLELDIPGAVAVGDMGWMLVAWNSETDPNAPFPTPAWFSVDGVAWDGPFKVGNLASPIFTRLLAVGSDTIFDLGGTDMAPTVGRLLD